MNFFHSLTIGDIANFIASLAFFGCFVSFLGFCSDLHTRLSVVESSLHSSKKESP